MAWRPGVPVPLQARISPHETAVIVDPSLIDDLHQLLLIARSADAATNDTSAKGPYKRSPVAPVAEYLTFF